MIDLLLIVIELESCHSDLDEFHHVGLYCALELRIVDWKGCCPNSCHPRLCLDHQDNGG